MDAAEGREDSGSLREIKDVCWKRKGSFFRLVFSSSERLHRRADPQDVSHEPGHPSYCDGVHAVRLHRPRPGDRSNRRPIVAQREGKVATAS